MANPLLIKVGAAVVKNADTIGKKIVIFIISFIILISAIGSSFISLITDVNGLKKDSDLQKSANYKKVKAAYEDYMENTLYPEMDKIGKELKEKVEEELNSHIQEEQMGEMNGENQETLPTEEPIEEEWIEVDVDIELNEINLAYILAYLTHITDSFKAGKGTVDKSEVRVFLSSINKIQTEKITETEYVIYNIFATPEEVAELFFSMNPELYMLSFDLYTEFIGTDDISNEEIFDNEDFEDMYDIPDTGMPIPQYYQNDYKHIRYGTGSIASSGCAPTSLAMVLSYLTGNDISPVDIVDFTGNRYYVPGSGSSWAIFSACAEQWGCTCVGIGKNLESVVNALNDGKPIIVSVGPGTFTKSGHIMVIRGIEDGCFLINDPNHSNLNKYHTDKFPITTVMKEAKNFWAFTN